MHGKRRARGRQYVHRATRNHDRIHTACGLVIPWTQWTPAEETRYDPACPECLVIPLAVSQPAKVYAKGSKTRELLMKKRKGII